MRDPAPPPVPISSHSLCHSRHLIPPVTTRTKDVFDSLRRLEQHRKVRTATRHADCVRRQGRNLLGRGSSVVACSPTPPSIIGGRLNRCNFRLASHRHMAGWRRHLLCLFIAKSPWVALRCSSSQLSLPTTNPAPRTVPQLNRRSRRNTAAHLGTTLADSNTNPG